MLSSYERDWDLLLPMVEFAYNTQVHSVTKQKPFTLQFGRIPTYPIDVTLGTSNPKLVSPDEYVANIRDNMSEIFQLVNENEENLRNKELMTTMPIKKLKSYQLETEFSLKSWDKEKMNRKFNPRTQDDVHMI